ncbi:MAG: glycosyltransferase family 4 protein [Gallionellaceae bacterium]
MIHFFFTFSKDASNSPFAHALRDINIEYRIFSDKISFRYRYRIWLLLVGWPKLVLFALKSVWRSQIVSRPRPDAVVVESHLEALIFGLVRRLLLRRKPSIHLLGFIYTRRQNPLLDSLRRFYFVCVFALIDGIICFSTLEVNRYKTLFPGARSLFKYIPYGLYIDGYEKNAEHCGHPINPEAYVFSAGRSGRDYQTLFDVFNRIDHPLHVICDSEAALAGCVSAPNITVLRNCYDACYVEELRNASIVVVPLAVDNISAGQMVLVQAMAYCKPLVVTQTPTIEDYLVDGTNALLIPRGDGEAMHRAIRKLLSDRDLAPRLARNALHSYETKHCMRAFVGNIINAVNVSE